jgi:hypothetical protein
MSEPAGDSSWRGEDDEPPGEDGESSNDEPNPLLQSAGGCCCCWKWLEWLRLRLLSLRV